MGNYVSDWNSEDHKQEKTLRRDDRLAQVLANIDSVLNTWERVKNDNRAA